MGQIADDMSDGTICSDCGMFFKTPGKPDHCYTHGYPVICRECWKNMTPKQRADARKAGLQQALVPLFGE